jgi:hypothetical protein
VLEVDGVEEDEGVDDGEESFEPEDPEPEDPESEPLADVESVESPGDEEEVEAVSFDRLSLR